MDDFFYPEDLNKFSAANECDLLRKAEVVLEFNVKTVRFEHLKAENAQQVIDLFFTVNEAFFKPESDEYSSDSSMKYSGRELYEIYSDNVAILTRMGHQNILEYPFSLFLAAVKNLKESNNGER